jgi:hypothetical protein
MFKTVATFAIAAAILCLAPPAQAACDDDDDCPTRIPFTRYIPRSLPDLPDMPKGLPKAAIPKAPPKVIERTIEKKAVETEAPRTGANALDDVKVVEKPENVRAPEPARVCTKYLPSLGRAVEIPCE